jgi:hypothetical protein
VVRSGWLGAARFFVLLSVGSRHYTQNPPNRKECCSIRYLNLRCGHIEGFVEAANCLKEAANATGDPVERMHLLDGLSEGYCLMYARNADRKSASQAKWAADEAKTVLLNRSIDARCPDLELRTEKLKGDAR